MLKCIDVEGYVLIIIYFLWVGCVLFVTLSGPEADDRLDIGYICIFRTLFYDL